jgi:hypothetical protein
MGKHREMGLADSEDDLGDPERSGEAAAEVQGCLDRCLTRYVRCGPARCPGICALIGFATASAIVGAGLAVFPLEIESNFGNFLTADIESSRLRDAFMSALSKRGASGGGRRLQEEPDEEPHGSGRRLQMLYKQFDLIIAYELNDEFRQTNILDSGVLTEIALFEEKLRQEWATFCGEADARDLILCDPGVSLPNFALPSLEFGGNSGVVPTSLTFDGGGRSMAPLATTFKTLEEVGVMPIVLPNGFDPEGQQATMIRSAFRFKFPCCTSSDSRAYQTQVVNGLKEQWATLIKETVLPILQDANRGIIFGEHREDEESRWIWPLRVYYEGDAISEFEVMQALLKDIFFSLGLFALRALLHILPHTELVSEHLRPDSHLSVGATVLCLVRFTVGQPGDELGEFPIPLHHRWPGSRRGLRLH